MKFVMSALSVFFLTYASVAYAGEPGLEHQVAPTKVLNFLEAPLKFNGPSPADAVLLSLRVKDAERLLASEDGQHWAPYGATAPSSCDAPPKLVGNSAGARAAHALELKRYKANCLPASKACVEATKFSVQHGVGVACSALYIESRVLLTSTAEQPDYVNPYDHEEGLPESDKPPIK